jgi:gluconolactonase
MKKRMFLLMGVLCTFGYYSCTKMVEDSNPVLSEEIATSKPTGNPSTFFDPAGLISASQHGVLDTIQKGFRFTEGPAVDKEGNVFFTDQPDDKIYRWDASTGAITTFLTGTGRANGMAFDKNGDLIACADMHGELWKIHPDGSHEVLVNNYGGKLLNGPNDVWVNPATGGIYITDPMFPRGYWDNTDPRKIGNAPGWPPIYSEQGSGVAGHVYYLAPGSNTLVRVTTMAGWNPQSTLPNGLAGSADGKKLYVNKWAGGTTAGAVGFPGGIWVFDINPDGTLSNMRTFVSNLPGCDGMSMDEQGNVYLSNGSGVIAFDPNGNRILTIPTGGGATNNVFAGKNNKQLIITGGGLSSPPFPNNQDRLTTVKMNVKGVEKF